MTGNTWNEEEKKNIRQALTVMIEIQKGYGKKFDLKTILMGWKMILEEDYTGKQILDACKEYMRAKDDIPSPANLIKIIEENRSPQELRLREWDMKVEGFVKRGFWISNWGAQPDEGNSQIPKEIIEKHGVQLKIEDKSKMVNIESYMKNIKEKLTH